MRADRLVSLALLLQARGRMSADDLAAELEVSVRTIYRDIAALSAAGIPVLAQPGPRGGCRLIDGYRFPLRGLSPDEAEALLILGVPAAVADLGLGDTLSAAHRKVSTSAVTPAAPRQGPLVHLDMPRWFHGTEPAPHLRTLAGAVRSGHAVELGYRREPGVPENTRVVGPLGLVNKAGTWYLVAARQAARENAVQANAVLTNAVPANTVPANTVPANTVLANAVPAGAVPGNAGHGKDGGRGFPWRGGDPAVFRVGRVTAARPLPSVSVTRPDGFDLAAFWERWSAAFMTSRSQVLVRVMAAPRALAIFPYVFGEAGRRAAEAAGPADAEGLREVTLSFEDEAVAAHRLAGFGGDLRVTEPDAVRDEVIAIARELLARYDPPASAGFAR